MEVSTKQRRIAELAKEKAQESFTALNHYLDMDWMKEAFRRLRRDSAAGVDGQTVAGYGRELEANLQNLIDRAKSGKYVAPPVRRRHIPKGDGKETRPHRYPDNGGQGASAGNSDAAGTDLRAGLHGMLKGNFVVCRKTARKRMSRSMKGIKRWMKENATKRWGTSGGRWGRS